MGYLTNIGKFQLEEGKKYFRKEPVNEDGFTDSRNVWM